MVNNIDDIQKLPLVYLFNHRSLPLGRLGSGPKAATGITNIDENKATQIFIHVEMANNPGYCWLTTVNNPGYCWSISVLIDD